MTEQQTLTLKDKAGFLPYDLRVNISPEIGKGFYHGDTIMTDNESPTGVNISLVDGIHIKPYLRSFDQLTKEIIHNGERFVPFKILFQVSAKEEEEYDLYGTIPEYWKQALNIGPNFWDFHQTQCLFEWHFNVFQLPEHLFIEKGSAIEKTSKG